MHLGKLYGVFQSRCSTYYGRLYSIHDRSKTLPKWEFNYLTEVLISDIWQCWCHFSRDLYLTSCRGTKARDGTCIISKGGDTSWQRLGYEATQSLRGHTNKATGHISFVMRKEPTWGDLDAFLRIVNGVRPANYNQLTLAYGSFTTPKDLQRIRNASAHKNVENLSSLSKELLTPGYSHAQHATDYAWQVISSNRAFALECWLWDLLKIADIATETA